MSHPATNALATGIVAAISAFVILLILVTGTFQFSGLLGIILVSILIGFVAGAYGYMHGRIADLEVRLEYSEEKLDKLKKEL